MSGIRIIIKSMNGDDDIRERGPKEIIEICALSIKKHIQRRDGEDVGQNFSIKSFIELFLLLDKRDKSKDNEEVRDIMFFIMYQIAEIEEHYLMVEYANNQNRMSTIIGAQQNIWAYQENYNYVVNERIARIPHLITVLEEHGRDIEIRNRLGVEREREAINAEADERIRKYSGDLVPMVIGQLVIPNTVNEDDEENKL